MPSSSSSLKNEYKSWILSSNEALTVFAVMNEKGTDSMEEEFEGEGTIIVWVEFVEQFSGP